MILKETLKQLEALGNEKMRAQNTKNGAHENQFGVRLGDIKKLAKKIKANHELALSLWDTENIDARLLATLIIKPNELSIEEMDKIVQSVEFNQVADWLNAYVVKNHPENEALRQLWMTSAQPMTARAGWNLTASRVVRDPEGLELAVILDRIESEMGKAAPEVQWTMNFHPCGNRHPLSRSPRASLGHWRKVRNLSRLSRFQRLHLSFCPNLD